MYSRFVQLFKTKHPLRFLNILNPYKYQYITMSTSIINQENVSPLNDEQKSDSLETKGLKRKLDSATDNETPNKRIKLTHDKPVLQIKLYVLYTLYTIIHSFLIGA